MSLQPQTTLYANPSDVYDYLSSEAVQLRLDDHQQAPGQTVQATANALQGATTINITVLRQPILPGTTLTFDGAGMPSTLDVVTSALAKKGDLTLTVNPLGAQVNALSSARDSGVNLALAARLVKACQYATAQIKMYCLGRYDDPVLAQSWSVNRWASVIAGRWVCRRRAQPCPKSIEKDAEEVMDEIKMVKMGQMNIEGIGTRTAGWPFISNVTVNPAYDFMKIRVEPPMSEPTPTQYGQTIDWNSALYVEVW